jgi:hypothetical protein
MLALETLLSFFVGNYDVLHFVRTNFMSEIAHSFNDMSDVWYFVTFSGMLQCLPWFISSAALIGEIAYVLLVAASVGLYIKIYPNIQKVSKQSVELLAAISSIALIIFCPHGYWSDAILYITPCLWLYIWSTSDEESFTKEQSIIRFIISIIIFYVPFFFWENLGIQARCESTITGYQIRIFILGIVLLSCAITALWLEFKKCQNQMLITDK